MLILAQGEVILENLSNIPFMNAWAEEGSLPNHHQKEKKKKSIREISIYDLGL